VCEKEKVCVLRSENRSVCEIEYKKREGKGESRGISLCAKWRRETERESRIDRENWAPIYFHCSHFSIPKWASQCLEKKQTKMMRLKYC